MARVLLIDLRTLAIQNVISYFWFHQQIGLFKFRDDNCN